MIVTEEKDDGLFEIWVWLIFLLFMVISGAFWLFLENWLLASIALGGALVWAVLAFKIVPPVFAGLVIRLGSRVITSENIKYSKIVDGKKIDITKDEFESPDFNPEASDIIREASTEYLTKKEGWTFVFPLLERIILISLGQHKEEINEKKLEETDEDYLKRAESFSTAEGVDIVPEMFYSYKITNLGMVLELGSGIDDEGRSTFLAEMFHNLILGGTRDVLARMNLKDILSRTIMENDKKILIGEKIRGEIIKTPNYDKLGAELLILRIEAIKFTKGAEDVRDALELITKQELKRESDVIDADAKLQVQIKASETLVNKSQAELTEARNKALALNADIAAFAGKKVMADEITTSPEDGKAYADYKVRLAIADALKTSTKVIVPAGDMSKMIAGLVNVFDASKPDVSKP